MSETPPVPPHEDPLVLPGVATRGRKKRGPNLGAIIIAVVAILGVGGGFAVLKFGAHVVPASALPEGVPSISEAERCLRNRNMMCAQANFIAYLKKYPDDTTANAKLAIILTADGRHHEALPYYRKAISLGAATYDLHASHARSLSATGDIDGAIRANYAALEIVPTLVDVRGDLADQLVRKGRAAEAINLLETFDRSLEDQGRPAYFPAHIDRIKHKLGGAAAAEAAASRAAANGRLTTAQTGAPGVTLVPLRRGPGVLYVPVTLNGVVEAEFTVDSGASEVVISEEILRRLIASKTVSRADRLGSGYAILADGSRIPSESYNLRSLKVGGRTLHNVTAAVSPGSRTQLLLGQSFLRRFKSWSIDNHKRVLELRD